MRWLSSTTLRVFRLLVGLAALLVAAWLIGRGAKKEAAVWVSLLVFGVFVIAHLLLDLLWARLYKGTSSSPGTGNADAGNAETGNGTVAAAPAPHGSGATTEAADITKAFRDTTGVVISTSGVVLGLVVVFSKHFTTPIKVGLLSLVAAILVAIVLYMSILYPLPEGERPNVLIRYLMTIAFFAFAFGLLLIAMSIVVG